MRHPTKCKSCGAKIVFLPTQGGRMMPTDWSSLPPQDKRNYEEGVKVMFAIKRGHVSHFATCPDAKKFRKGKNLETKTSG